ncbi:hypothetical protein PROVRETT_07481 [Providencia rettgeri DSM 1131]|uniref:hypothetical protein n=1 Tax=Providencia rettgeri TaxID=587 RepID=UPI000197BF78|nr:hypothetical protein PROVRETT_07481 [Providencia rettgeri DSM 1131]QXA59114.1 class I SAM-dependent methyltransferase [Providencia rettgeri]
MYKDSVQARRKIAQIFDELNYQITPQHWQVLCMGINRDLQAKKLRPNVPVPSRRNVLPFLKMMYKETGSIFKALKSFTTDGPWTSSGGSFRLAKEIDFDIPLHIKETHKINGEVTYLEVGAAWAGFNFNNSDSHELNISGLAKSLNAELGKSIFFHFTNLTPWHKKLPNGVIEHPYITASGLRALENRGLTLGNVDIIYSQAAVYFEQDFTTFICNAARLLKEGGVLIFNHEPKIADAMDKVAQQQGLRLMKRKHVGGMNGDIVYYSRQNALISNEINNSPVQHTEFVCKSILLSVLRRDEEI